MIVTDAQVVEAMKFYEEQHVRDHGPLDRVSLPKEVGLLADLLGAMWFAKEHQAFVRDSSPMATLLKGAPIGAQPELTPGTSPTDTAHGHNELPQDCVPGWAGEDDATCEACQ